MMNPVEPAGHALLVQRAAVVVCLAIGIKTFAGLWLFGPAMLAFSPALLLQLAGHSAALTEAMDQGQGMGWVLPCYASFVALFLWTGMHRPSAAHKRRCARLALQLALALLMDERLLVLVATELALWLPRRQALSWLAAQIGLTLALHACLWFVSEGGSLSCWFAGTGDARQGAGLPLAEALHELVLSLLSQATAFGFGFLGAGEQRRRLQLAAAHAQRMATQRLLAEAARAAERMRAARDLHDAIGHQLMALKLHLDLAARRAGPGRECTAVQAARLLAEDLLATVRRVVHSERQAAGDHPGSASRCADQPGDAS
jgi:signal transduction histidine kinase